MCGLRSITGPDRCCSGHWMKRGWCMHANPGVPTALPETIWCTLFWQPPDRPKIIHVASKLGEWDEVQYLRGHMCPKQQNMWLRIMHSIPSVITGDLPNSSKVFKSSPTLNFNFSFSHKNMSRDSPDHPTVSNLSNTSDADLSSVVVESTSNDETTSHQMNNGHTSNLENNSDSDFPRRIDTTPRGSRTNEYFIRGEGIEREVITADITLYLGNDALVRPGTFEVSVLWGE